MVLKLFIFKRIISNLRMHDCRGSSTIIEWISEKARRKRQLFQCLICGTYVLIITLTKLLIKRTVRSCVGLFASSSSSVYILCWFITQNSMHDWSAEQTHKQPDCEEWNKKEQSVPWGLLLQHANNIYCLYVQGALSWGSRCFTV